MRDIVIYNKNNLGSYRVIKSFKTIASLDDYTRNFDSEIDLLNELISSLSSDDAKKIRDYISSNKGKLSLGVIMNKEKYNKIIPILYSNDMFDSVDLIDKFKKYFCNNQKDVIYNFDLGIGKVKFYQDGNKIEVFKARKPLKIGDVIGVTNSYLEGSNYKKYRDIYFNMKSRGIEPKKITLKGDKEKKDMFYLEEDDDYARYLRSYSTLGEEEYDDAVDEFMLTYMPLDSHKKK